MEQPYYDIANKAMSGRPFAPYPLAATVRYRFDGLTLETTNTVQVINKVNGPGTLRFPMPVGPAVSVALSPSAGVVPLGEKSFPVSVRLHNNIEGEAKATVRLNLPGGWTSDPQSIPIAFSHLGEEQALSFTIYPKSIEEKPYQITAVAECSGRQYTEGYVTVGYTGLRPYFLYSPAAYKTAGAENCLYRRKRRRRSGRTRGLGCPRVLSLGEGPRQR